FFFSSRRRHTRSTRDWSSDVCSSDLRYPSIQIHKRDVVPIDSLVVDSGDPFRVADFWIWMLGYREHESGDVGIEIVGDRDGDPMLSFVTVPEQKIVKIRIHLDVQHSHSIQAVLVCVEMLRC